MKKTLLAKLALAGTVGLVAAMASGTASAAICSSCHTMHNSQDGNPMRTSGEATPLPVLLMGSCVECHSGLNTGTTLQTTQPKVLGTAEPDYSDVTNSGGVNRTLAGGDFWWVNTKDSAGHNVVDFGFAQDGALGTKPPGGADTTEQIRCAGLYGCHGTIAETVSLAAMSGAHHFVHNTPTNSLVADGGTIDGTTVGGSFRYLHGVRGIEDSDWQHTEDSGDHNQYLGYARSSADASYAIPDKSISALCARCHGSYHNTLEGDDNVYGINEDNTNFGNGQWVRHPTDYDMGSVALTEFDSYITYDITAPVGRISGLLDSATMTDVATVGTRIVLCVSCHRAHGSPYDDLLRWDYAGMQVGTTNATTAGTGCFACHSFKDGV